MKIEEFAENVKEGLQKYFGEEVQVCVNPVQKNNGVILTGIVIFEKGNHVAPTIYMESFWEEYKKGKELGGIVLEIVKIYEDNRFEYSGELESFETYENAKKKIYYKLVNAEKNKKLLEEIPFFPFLDLAIVFYCDCSNGKFGKAAILIKNMHLEMWGVTPSQVYEEAIKNTPLQHPYEILSMNQVIREMYISDMKKELERFEKEDVPEEWFDLFADKLLEEEEEQFTTPMYVLSNIQRMNGASCILYEDILGEFAKEIEDSFYILPSSVHELILVPAGCARRAEELREMVEEINVTQVGEEEVLSDSVYFYDRMTKKLALA